MFICLQQQLVEHWVVELSPPLGLDAAVRPDLRVIGIDSFGFHVRDGPEVDWPNLEVVPPIVSPRRAARC